MSDLAGCRHDLVQTQRPALYGVTLEKMLIELLAHYGWEEMGRRVAGRCFLFDPSVRSSLSFLRKTPWARSKVEAMYVSWKAAQPNGSS